MFSKKTFIFVLLNLFFYLGFSFASETTLEKIVVKSKDSNPYVIGQGEINNKSTTSITDLLNYPLGTDLLTRGLFGAEQDLSARGGNYEQNSVMINNQRVNDPQTGHFNLDLPLTIEDIDFVKAEYSELTPNSTTGGVNFVTKRPLENKFVSRISGGKAQFMNLCGKPRPLALKFCHEP